MARKPMQPLVLASTSPYRRRLLERLQLSFTVATPDVDETPREGEAPATLALRLGKEKALSVAAHHPSALVIGSDQVAALGQTLLGKPGTVELACEQLSLSSGREVTFYTSLALARGSTIVQETCVETCVRFRTLSTLEIEDYVHRESPLDCAGSFRWETLGIALFEQLNSSDPTALEGLPLIALTTLLKKEELNILNSVS